MTNDLVKRLRECRLIQFTTCGEGKDIPSPIHVEAADCLEELEADVAKLESIAKEDNSMLRTYHKWCELNGCAPSSSDLMKARAALEGKDD